MFKVFLWPLTGDADGAAAGMALPAYLHRGWGEALNWNLLLLFPFRARRWF